MNKLILAFFLFGFLALSASAQNWQLIYHNDPNGNSVEGEIGDLIHSIRDGEVVRIAWWAQHPENPKIKVEHLVEASFLTIMSDSIVFAQIEPIAGQIPNFKEGTITLKENLEWRMIGGTNGTMERWTRNMLTGEMIEHKSSGRAFKWYIQKND